MNKKGAGIGGFILFFIGVIVALTLIVSTAQSIGDMTNTRAIANQSTAVMVDGTAQYLTNCRALSSAVVYNATGDYLVGADNYTITNNVVYNGNLAVKVTPGTLPNQINYVWLVSGTCQPLTYADDSATRTVGGLIVIMSAIGILGFAVWFFGRESGWM